MLDDRVEYIAQHLARMADWPAASTTRSKSTEEHELAHRVLATLRNHSKSLDLQRRTLYAGLMNIDNELASIQRVLMWGGPGAELVGRNA